MKVVLNITETQYTVLVNALEDYSRIIAGQFDVLRMPYYDRTAKNGTTKDFDRKLKELKQIAFPELAPNEDYGITCNETPIDSKIAYELYKALRHERWRHQPSRSYCTVDSDGPLRVSGEALPSVEIIKEADNPENK